MKKLRDDDGKTSRAAHANELVARASNPYSIVVFSIPFFARAISFFKSVLRFALRDHARNDARRRAKFARARTPFVKWSRGF